MREEAKKPEGGFVLVQAWALVAAWQAVRAAILKPVDLRVWLATFEAVARRCGARKGSRPEFHIEELAVLTRSAVRTVTESVARLRACGLVDFRRDGVTHGGTLGDLTMGDRGEVLNALALVANHNRRVPIPRRLLLFLARTEMPVLVATAFGHLLRCLYLRGELCSSGGLCKAAWVAEVFGVSERSVKRARAELLQQGALLRSPTPQWVLNRWGPGLRWNLAWKPAANAAASPPHAESHVGVSPPRRTGNSLKGSENQQLVGGGRSGACARPAKGLGHVQPEDLRTVGRLRALFARATRAGLVRASEADALNFAAAAAHAVRVGSRNPEGLFAAVVRRGLWAYLSLEDETRGRRVAQRLLPEERTRADTRALSRACVPERTAELSPEYREQVRRMVLESLTESEMFHEEYINRTAVGA